MDKDTRTRRRRRRAGVAMIEAIVVTTVTMFFFAGTLFFHNLVGRKALALRTARYEAWAATRFNCGEASVTGQDSQSVPVPRPLSSPTVSVDARVQMACNVEPREGDTIVEAVLSTLDVGDLL